MNEAETRAELIDPALKTAGWGVIEHSRIRRELIAPGRLIGNGKRFPRIRRLCVGLSGRKTRRHRSQKTRLT